MAARIKAVDTYDGKFDLTKEAEGTLTALLSSEVFCKQVVKETQQPDGTQVEYTGILFQPVPWSPTTKKGMPQEFEKYHADPDYVMINIPPNFMFKAKVFKPSRLCAIYRKL
ncbi:g2778 [Coccomyxa elongata]